MKRRPASTAAFSPRCAVGAETEARSPATRLLIPTSLLRFRFAALCITTTTAAMGFGSMVRSKASQAPMTSRSSWPPWCAAGFSATHCTAFLNDRWIAASRWEADFLARWMEIGWVASRLAISSVRSFSVCPIETTRVATACKCCDPEAYSTPADEPGAPAIAVEVGCSSSRMSPAPAKASTNSTTSLRRGASGRSERSRSTAVSQDTSGVETPPARCGAPGGTDARLHTGHAGGVQGGQAQRDKAAHQEPGCPDLHSAGATDDEEDVAPLGGTAAGEDVGEAGLVQQAAHDVRVSRSIAWFAELGVEVERHRAEAPVLVAEGHHVGQVGDLGRPRLRGAEGRVVVCEQPHVITTAAERPHHRVGALQLGLAGEDLGGVVVAADTTALRARGPAEGVTLRSR